MVPSKAHPAKTALRGISAAVVLTALALSCSARRDALRDSQGPRPWEEARNHWIHDQRLRELMADLVRRRWPERAQDPQRASREQVDAALANAADLAEALARAGEEIPQLVADRRMSEADRRSFTEQAVTLRDQAIELKTAADEGNVEQMQRVLDRIDATCGSCHDRFRDFSGLLELRRASIRPHHTPQGRTDS